MSLSAYEFHFEWSVVTYSSLPFISSTEQSLVNDRLGASRALAVKFMFDSFVSEPNRVVQVSWIMVLLDGLLTGMRTHGLLCRP